MKSLHRLLFAAAAFILLAGTGCGAPASTSAPAPAPTSPTTLSMPSGTVIASAVVAPASQAELAFQIGGFVKEVNFEAGDPVAAEQTLAVVASPELEYAVLQAQEAARAAEFRYQYWIPARLDRPPERRQLAEQEFIQVQRSLDVALANFQQIYLRVPFDGVLARVDIVPGETVQPGQTVALVADLDHLLIETTDLNEKYITEVKVGQKAEVFVEALGQTLKGRVSAIAPRSDTLGGDVIYKVTITLDSVPPALRWGMTAEAHIFTE